MRVYERDSRQIRQVSVNQHFVPDDNWSVVSRQLSVAIWDNLT